MGSFITSGIKFASEIKFSEFRKALKAVGQAGYDSFEALVKATNEGDTVSIFKKATATDTSLANQLFKRANSWFMRKWEYVKFFWNRFWSSGADEAVKNSVESVSKTAEQATHASGKVAQTFKAGETFGKEHLINDASRGVFKLSEQEAQVAQKLHEQGAFFKLSHGPSTPGKTDTFFHLIDDPQSVHKYTKDEIGALLEKGVPLKKLAESTSKLEAQTLETFVKNGYSGEDITVLHNLGLTTDSSNKLLKAAKDVGITPQTMVQVMSKPSTDTLQEIATLLSQGKPGNLRGYNQAVFNRLKQVLDTPELISLSGRMPSMGGKVAALESAKMQSKIAGIYYTLLKSKKPDAAKLIEQATTNLAIQDANFIRQTMGSPEKLTHQSVLEKLSELSQGTRTELEAFIHEAAQSAKKPAA